MDKILSGRWILTITSALVFLYLSATHWIKADDAMQIITMVFVMYFSRPDRNSQTEEKK